MADMDRRILGMIFNELETKNLVRKGNQPQISIPQRKGLGYFLLLAVACSEMPHYAHLLRSVILADVDCRKIHISTGDGRCR